VFSTDCFYDGDPELLARMRRHRITGIDMESAGLYGLAMREGFRALSVLAVSDLLPHGAHMPAHEREQGLARMVQAILAGLAADARDAAAVADEPIPSLPGR
jgi:purine-nucleoside phosphorylase